MRWIQAVGRVVVLALGVIVAIRLVQAVGAHSLWIDEWCTVGLAFRPSKDFVAWFRSLAIDPHFPTIYILTRWFTPLVAFAQQPPEALARMPATLLVAATLGVAMYWSVAKGRSVTGVSMALVLVGILLADDHWHLHATEGRMYGLMGALGVAMVVAVAVGRPVAASLCGMGLVLLHPFGMLVGFAPSIVVLGASWLGVAERFGVRHRGVRIVFWGTVATVFAAGWWCVNKFVLHQTNGFGFNKRGDDILIVLGGLSRWSVAAAVGVTAVTFMVFVFMSRRRTAGGEPIHRWLAFAVYALLFLSLGAGVAALALFKPAVGVPSQRYVAWVNPTLLAIVAASLGLVLDYVLEERPGESALRSRIRAPVAILGIVATGAWSFGVARSVALGPPWGDGLREAAAYLVAAAGPKSAVAHDTFEMFPFPASYMDGSACMRAGQIVPYLTPEIRARMPCQDETGRVVFGPDVARVFVVREPIAWTGPRVIVLDGFRRSQLIKFENTVVEQYDREAR